MAASKHAALSLQTAYFWLDLTALRHAAKKELTQNYARSGSAVSGSVQHVSIRISP
jgi:hypothetical protein